MAQLKYCDKHNQVGFLLKPTESAGYTEIVDFLRRSKLRYALTHNPPIYDSLVKQFWQTATARTLADGTQQLNATIDTIEHTITEESVRRQLQLADASGIHMLQNEEIFEGLQNIGYVNDRTFTFWKSHFTPQWRFLIHHILHCLSSKSGGWDQFGSNIAIALICLSTGRDFNFSKLIFDGMISNLKSKSKFLMYPRFLQMILNVQTENKNLFVPVSLTKKIFGNMKRGFQGIHRPLLPVMLTIDAGQPQPSADPTPSQSVPATSSSHVQITQPPPTVTHSVQPPPQPSSVQPTSITPPTQPVQTTSPPPVSTIPDIQPTLPPSPQIPSPSYHDTEGPSFETSYHMSPPPSHEPELQALRSSEESEQLRNLMDIVPRLESRVKSLEKELSETKQSLGTEIFKLNEKVKKLEDKLRKKRKSKEAKDADKLQQDLLAEEAETESNVWDDGSEDVNPFGGGNPGKEIAPAKHHQIITTNTTFKHQTAYNEVWKVIQNGNSKKRVTKGKDGVYRVLPPTTQEEQVADEKERKARTLLLMAVPKDHLRRFHGMDDAKEIWAAIKTRFGGNANSKKMQKAVLKQQFEAFTISSKESYAKSLSFLRSLPPAWDSLAMTMRTKKNIDTLSIDDLYNNLSVFEQDIQKTSSSSLASDNVAFISQAKASSSKHSKPSLRKLCYYYHLLFSNSNTNCYSWSCLMKGIHSFLATNADDVDLIHEDLDQIDDLDLEEMDINWQIAMTAIKIKKFYKKTGRRPRVDGKMHVAFDKRKVECFNCHNTGHFARECKFKGTKDGQQQLHGSSRPHIKSEFTSSFNTGKQHVNSGSMYVNSGTKNKSGGSRVNTGNQNVNSGRVTVNAARVNRPVLSNQTSQDHPLKHMEHRVMEVSVICDKKLNVLFTEKECFVVSSDFKMPDENQVLLGVEKSDARSTWAWKRKCQVSLANWMQFDYLNMSNVTTPVLIFKIQINFTKCFTWRKLKYCDSTTKWVITSKPTECTGYTELVDFLRRIKIESLLEGAQLADASGITYLQNERLFEGLQTIGSKREDGICLVATSPFALICLSTEETLTFQNLSLMEISN
ncbi:ribonuclease H-like domain-containing protein [Tanacetum coccineum]|uniref:Ribonuclease H-like domain-containing protein n=1 Tax=Tanacetum coccineum TaxID=301880 RepID=A0ABQ4X5M1_9ASTR